MRRNKSTKPPTVPVKLGCGNCCGGLSIEHEGPGVTLICPVCQVRVAGPFFDAHDIPEYVAADAAE
jgi:hypothetical protein